MDSILLIFPHQLFESHPGLAEKPDAAVLIEDSLYFGDGVYPARFHKQKLWLHRASMKRYEQRLQDSELPTSYVEYDPGKTLAKTLAAFSAERNRPRFIVVDPTDFILEKRLRAACQSLGCDFDMLDSPNFLNSRSQNEEYRRGKKRWFMADFYKFQRKRLNILMDDNQPVGGKWSFDAENRKKVPRKLLDSIPKMVPRELDAVECEARDYVNQSFPENPGKLASIFYPTTHLGAADWLDRFLHERFELFGVYEDAIVQGESCLWHSVLTPMLNVGLLSPKQVIERTLDFADDHDVPINSIEGFVRQIIGWREFMRATYEDIGVAMRTANHWGHHREIPASFYAGTTGIIPIDDTIHRLLDTGYCHHIERLMVLGGFMFLCEFSPDEIYRWFMEMFVDSYDWVMVPNVYAMSQHADGGLITTKPYFSGSSYVRKMSHYKNDTWCEIWDGLYWRWIIENTTALSKNPRWAMMCRMAAKMETSKRERHLSNAAAYLSQLDQSTR